MSAVRIVALGGWLLLGLGLVSAARAQDSTGSAAPPAVEQPQVEQPAKTEPKATVPEPAAKTVAPQPAAAAPAPTAPATEKVVLPQPSPLHESASNPLSAPPTDAKPSKTARMCGVCHSDIRVKFDKGIHKSEEIGCTSCHGGNADAITVATAHAGGFRGRPHRRDIPTLCGSCHSDVARMRPYQLPSDQLELYRTSAHGLALARGNENAAVCTDCHGVHEIRPADDPQSMVARHNVPTTCGRCHGGNGDAAHPATPGSPLADYQAGIHGQALLVGNNNAAPECANCHGSHATAQPGARDVDKVCGQCHGKVRSYFMSSPHRGAVRRGGHSDCAVCHGNHKTTRIAATAFEKTCASCHDAGTTEGRIAGRIQAMLADASTQIDRAHERVKKAEGIPLYVEDYQARLEDARTSLMEAAPATHTVDTTTVEPHTRRARSIAAEVAREVDEKLAGRWWRYVGLGLFWFYLILTGAILLRWRRRAIARGTSLR
jgi:cytochrome c3-like protein